MQPAFPRPSLPAGFALPDGAWRLASDKRASTGFNAELRPVLTPAVLVTAAAGDAAGAFLVTNMLHMLYIYPLPSAERVSG